MIAKGWKRILWCPLTLFQPLDQFFNNKYSLLSNSYPVSFLRTSFLTVQAWRNERLESSLIPVAFRCQPGGKQNSVGSPIFADPPVQTLLGRSFSHYIHVNIWTLIYLNRGEWCEDMIDHSSCAHNLSSCENKIQAWAGFEPMTSAILVQCCTSWATEPSGSWPLCELVIYQCWS